MSGCKTEEIILHGEISGIVTDTLTSQPLKAVTVKLNPVMDTLSTGNDGKFLFKSLVPGDYEIQASKSNFISNSRKVKVASAQSLTEDISLSPLPKFSANCLDFGLDLTSISFTISNPSKSNVSYLLRTSQNWINIYPGSGDLAGETDTIIVTVDKTGLTSNVYTEIIELITSGSQFLRKDTIYVGLNGLLDSRDLKNYKVAEIGNQTWMAENLNIGTLTGIINPQTDNGTIDKYCYDDDIKNCNIYGGLYQWGEFMQYHPSDSGIIGITKGICPDGWHIPTINEWLGLITYCAGGLFYTEGYGYRNYIGGGKLKETGTSHWLTPNFGATNESGFFALPGGDGMYIYRGFNALGIIGFYGTSEFLNSIWLRNDNDLVTLYEGEDYAYSVRCIKDPPQE